MANEEANRGLEASKFLGWLPPGASFAGGFYLFSQGTVWGYVFGTLALAYLAAWFFANATGLVLIGLQNVRHIRRRR